MPAQAQRRRRDSSEYGPTPFRDRLDFQRPMGAGMRLGSRFDAEQPSQERAHMTDKVSSSLILNLSHYRCRPAQVAKQLSTTSMISMPDASDRQISWPRMATGLSALACGE